MLLYLIHPVHSLQILHLMGDNDKNFIRKIIYEESMQEFIILSINVSSSLI